MLTEQKWDIVAIIPDSIRDLLLRMFPPKFERVLAKEIIWAKNVSDDFEYPKTVIECEINGLFRDQKREALLCNIDGGAGTPQLAFLHLDLSASTEDLDDEIWNFKTSAKMMKNTKYIKSCSFDIKLSRRKVNA